MRLSQIKLAGFKSFVDVTTLPLPSNLTSVVGPNGCGKSNIIDAVRWVLGESSMKQLRSASSEDVIFSGSRSRKPVGRASVELTFDNSDQTLQGPYAHYTEVAVRREITRDGQSQYFLNGSKCLRRDIVDLFLGTGLGARSGYAIIEQGMVSRMIEAKPEELRQWLEEAAGISRYRERRRETESRIRSTRDNLSRIDDLCGEVRARARALERQAANARKYKEYRADEDRLKVEIHYLNTRDTETAADAAAATVATAEHNEHAARAARNAARDARLAAETELEAERSRFAEQQSAHYGAEAERARAEQTLRHARELAEMRSREITQLDGEQQRAREQQASAEQQAAAARSREQQLQAELATASQALAEAESALAANETQLESASAQLSEFDAASREPLQQLAAERARLREREQSLEQLQARTTRLEREREQAPAPDTQALEAAREAAEAGQRAVSRAQEALSVAESEVERCEARRATADTELASARDAAGRLLGEQSSLKTLQAAALGNDDAERRDWLNDLGLGDSTRLAEKLRVTGGWDTAVEHVLGSLLQAPLSDRFDAAVAAAAQAPESGAALVDGAPAAGEAVSGTLAAQVQAPQAVTEQLGRVHCADDDAAAARMLAELPAESSVITRAGVWRGHGWLQLPVRGAGQGVLARASRLDALEALAEQARQRASTAEAEAEAARGALGEATNQRRAAAADLDASRRKAEQASQAQQRAQQQADARSSRLQTLDDSLNEVRAELATRTEDVSSLRDKVAELAQTGQQMAEQREALEAGHRQMRTARDSARTTVNEARNRQSDTQSRLSAAGSEAASATQRAQEAAARATQLSASLAERRHQPEQESSLQAAQQALEAAQAQQAQAQQTLAAARTALEAREQALATARQQEQKTQADFDAAQETLQQSRIEFQGLDARRQTLAARFAEFGVTRAAVAEALPEDAELAAWQERLEQTQRRIERLGAINLAAIEELEETQARAEELARQHADISEALETLEAAIRKIDRETRDRFRDTFEKVNTRFAARFPLLFGGGEAALELTDDDLLSAGVRVMARPPGKRNTSIHLLSGGEKAMTAVALLLALFELNPAPFCLLDEVDAPLDDANVSRFCDVIRDMSQSVQFVIITHNKITMALAEHLHGVTMAEPGSSRLVSVDVQAAAELAGEAA